LSNRTARNGAGASLRPHPLLFATISGAQLCGEWRLHKDSIVQHIVMQDLGKR
jgi:hypothetical protein